MIEQSRRQSTASASRQIKPKPHSHASICCGFVVQRAVQQIGNTLCSKKRLTINRFSNFFHWHIL